MSIFRGYRAEGPPGLTGSTRRRFEEERKELGAVKAKLVKENQVKKARLEDLEKQLTEFVEVRLDLLRNFHRAYLRNGR